MKARPSETDKGWMDGKSGELIMMEGRTSGHHPGGDIIPQGKFKGKKKDSTEQPGIQQEEKTSKVCDLRF